jgi:hypothetical protein
MFRRPHTDLPLSGKAPPQVGSTAMAIRTALKDHEPIKPRDCDSLLNMP